MKARNLITTLMLTLGLTVTGAAVAQQDNTGQQQRNMPNMQQQEQIDVTDAQLQKFADAQTQVQTIQEDFSGRLEGVEDQEKAYELQVEANKKMTSAVKDAGLDVQTYNQIAMAVQNDPELKSQLEGMQ